MTRLLSSFVFMLLLLPAIVRAQCNPVSFSYSTGTGQMDTLYSEVGDTIWLYGSAATAVIDTSSFQWYDGQGNQKTGDTVFFEITASGWHNGGVRIVGASGCTSGVQPINFISTSKLNWQSASYSDSICINEVSNIQFGLLQPDTLYAPCDELKTDPLYLEDDFTSNPDPIHRDTLTINCFNPGQTIVNSTDLISICLNIEHSWVGDLSIIVFSPTGDSVVLYPQSATSSSHLGEPVDLSYSANIPGVGYTYCFTETQPDFGTLGSSSSSTHTFVNADGDTHTSASYKLPGSYLPEEPFSQFIGSSLNGEWIIQIQDHNSQDNGWLFDWSIDFNPQYLTNGNQRTSEFSTSWTGPASFQGGAYSDVNVFSPTQTGTYSFNTVVTDTVFNRSVDTSFSIFVDTFPVPSANDADVCVNGTFPWLVNHNPAFESAWYYPDTTTLWAMGDSVAPPTLATADTHYVYLKATSRLCGSAWDSARYIRYPALNIATQNATVLSGQTVTLGATASNGSGSYSYSWVPSNFLTGANTANPTTIPLTSDVNFLMTVTDNVRGCSGTRIIQVEVLSPLSVSAGTSDTLCLGDSILLQGSYDNNGAPVDSLYWTSASGAVYVDSVWISPTQSEQYTFHGIDGAFTDSDSLFISVSSASSAGSDLTISYCYSASPSLAQLLSSSADTGGYWIDSTDQIIDPATPNRFGTFRYILEQNPCPNDTAVYSLTFSGNGTLPLADTARWCAKSGIQMGIGITVDTDTASVGLFPYPEIFSNGSCTDTVFHFYEIKAQPEIQWATQAASFCIDDSPVLLNVSPSGGVLSGNGLVGDSFDPSLAGAGVHELIYSIDWSGCTDSDTLVFTVNPLPVVGFNSTPDTLCINESSILLDPYPSGGTLSGIGVNGLIFDPAVGGIGTHVIQYSFTDPQGCENADSIAITVVPTTTPSIQMPDSICLSSNSLQLSATPLGGSFFGPGVSGSTLNISANTVYTVGYSFTNSAGCSDTAYHAIYTEINPTVTATDLGPFCIDQGSLSLNNAQPAGGTYLSSAVLGQTLDLTLLGAGTHQIQYTFSTAAGCTDTSSFSVIIDPSVVASVQGIPDTLCQADAPISLLSSTNITSLIDNSLALQIDPAALDTGWHVLQTATFNSTCSDTVSQNFWIGAQANLVAPAPPNVCVNDGLQPLPSILPSSGIMTGPGIIGADFDPSIAGPGNHVFWYHYQSAGGCQDSVSFNWIVTNTSSLSITDYGNTLCENDSPEFLNMVQPQGGSYSGPGVTSGFFDPQLAGSGTHTLSYSFTNSAGCTSDTTLIFIVLPLPNTQLVGLPDLCLNDPPFALTGGFPAGGTYSSLLQVGSELVPNAVGVFEVSYTYSDPLTGCQETAIDSVQVFDLPPVPSITQNGNELIATTGSYQYYWYLNGNLIPGANSANLFPSQDGDYTVQITDGNTCSNTSSIYTYSTISTPAYDADEWNLFPNPTARLLHLSGPQTTNSWQVVNSVGQTVIRGEGAFPEELSVKDLSAGHYTLLLILEKETRYLPFIRQ